MGVSSLGEPCNSVLIIVASGPVLPSRSHSCGSSLLSDRSVLQHDQLQLECQDQRTFVLVWLKRPWVQRYKGVTAATASF